MHNLSFIDEEGWSTMDEREYLTISNPLRMLNQYEIRVQLKMNTPNIRSRYHKSKMTIQSPKVTAKNVSVDLQLPKIQREAIKLMSLDLESNKKKQKSQANRNSCQIKVSYPEQEILVKQTSEVKKMREIGIGFRRHKVDPTAKRLYSNYKGREQMISATQRCLNNFLKERSLRAQKYKQKVFQSPFVSAQL